MRCTSVFRPPGMSFVIAVLTALMAVSAFAAATAPPQKPNQSAVTTVDLEHAVVGNQTICDSCDTNGSLNNGLQGETQELVNNALSTTTVPHAPCSKDTTDNATAPPGQGCVGESHGAGSYRGHRDWTQASGAHVPNE